MAINNNLGFKETVRALGLERRFFGFESDKSLRRRVVTAMGNRRITSFFELMGRAPTPRVCIREEYFEFGRGGKLWVYHYNDGTIENVILRGA